MGDWSATWLHTFIIIHSEEIFNSLRATLSPDYFCLPLSKEKNEKASFGDQQKLARPAYVTCCLERGRALNEYIIERVANILGNVKEPDIFTFCTWENHVSERRDWTRKYLEYGSGNKCQMVWWRDNEAKPAILDFSAALDWPNMLVSEEFIPTDVHVFYCSSMFPACLNDQFLRFEKFTRGLSCLPP